VVAQHSFLRIISESEKIRDRKRIAVRLDLAGGARHQWWWRAWLGAQTTGIPLAWSLHVHWAPPLPTSTA